MSSFDSDPQSRALSASSAPSHRTRAGSAAGFLLARDGDTRRESRRVLIGFVLFLALGIVAVNFGLYRSAETRLEQEGWARLDASADLRRDQLAHTISEFRAEAVGLARESWLMRDVHLLVSGTLPRAARDQLVTELGQRQDLFGFENVQILLPRGAVLLELAPSVDAEQHWLTRLVRQVGAGGQDVVGDPFGDELMVGVPVFDAAGRVEAVVLVHRIDVNMTARLLGPWPGLGTASGAYIVRKDGTDALVLTDYAGSSLRPGGRASLSSSTALAPSMAATGVESRVGFTDGNGRPAWAVTRRLPGTDWGMVAQTDRGQMTTALRSTAEGLLLIDLAIALVVLGLAWVWRRVYESGLATREREITDRHSRRVQAIFDTAFDAIFTYDREGRIRTVNRAAAALFARSPDEMEDQYVQRFMTWGRGSAVALPAPGSVGTGEALRPDGRTLPVEFSVATAGAGQELVYTAILRDISDRVEAEQQIRAFAEGLEVTNRRLEEANAQLEEASRLKSEFLANTSHELRTPLNGMIGFLQLVLDGMCDSPDEERDFLRQALQCSRHLLGLINDVLDIAKIEAGKLVLEIDRVDVQQLFDEVYTVTHVQAAQRGVQLKFETDLEPGVAARGDFGKIKQVLINLVGNSMKFTPRGSIKVRAYSKEALGHLMFEVVDTGIGIPRERQQMIFEKFVQADGSTTRRFGGTGLGLAISRSLVELMGGIIGVFSEGEGHGTRMYFSLPVWRTEAAAPIHVSEGEQIRGPQGGALVLVVEDDPVFRRFLTAVLQQNGYRTAEADHAEAGWMLVRRLQPSCVVLDYALSCGDTSAIRTGWDLAQRMTTEPETRRIPIVFVTGFDGELTQKLRDTAFARHPAHLVKPIEGRALVERIESLVGETGTPVRVLMADDDPTVAAYIRKVLPADRYRITVTSKGEECLHALRTQPNGFDVLLLDLMMPEVSGYDVLREMTLSGLQSDLPVLVLTNFPEARNEEERRLLERGLVLDVIAKSAVHDNPQLLPHVLDWHLQVPRPDAGDDAAPGLEAA